MYSGGSTEGRSRSISGRRMAERWEKRDINGGGQKAGITDGPDHSSRLHVPMAIGPTDGIIDACRPIMTYSLVSTYLHCCLRAGGALY